MHTRLTKEGRAVRSAFAKLIMWTMMIVLAAGGVGMAGRTVVPAVSAWWHTPSVETPAPAMAVAPQPTAPPRSTYQPPTAPTRYEPLQAPSVYIPPSGGSVEYRRFELKWPWDKKRKEKERPVERQADAVTHHGQISAHPPTKSGTTSPQAKQKSPAGSPGPSPKHSSPPSPPKHKK